jgi:preprotein translocase subunit Sec61beta
VRPVPKTSKRKKKRRGDAPLPSGGAGLVRFFEDETIGVKVGPTLVIFFAVMLVVVVIAAHVSVQIGLFG